MIVGLVDNEYPSGSSMSASVIICIVLLGLIPKSKLLRRLLWDPDPTVPRKLGQTKSREQRRQTGHSEQNLRHRSRSPDITIGHCWHHDPTRHRTRSSRPGTSDPRPRSGRQSIPIGHALGNGLVQPIFRPPSRRPPSDCSPSVSRRAAGLKMLCIMFYTRNHVYIARSPFEEVNPTHCQLRR